MIDNLWEYTQLFCTVVMTLGGAGAIIISIIKWMRRPDGERDEKLKRHDEMLDNDNKRLKSLEESQADTDEAMRVMMKSMLALMSHELDGNHHEELKIARDELQSYLIRR